MSALSDAELLALWEVGASRHALDRCVLLAATARPEWPADEVADQPLGAINTSLLEFRAAAFGTRIDVHTDCPQCGERLAFALDVRALLAGVQGDEGARTLEAAGLQLRKLSLRDLAAVAAEEDVAVAARMLLARCTLGGDARRLDEARIRAAEDALEAFDPQADLALAVHCPACGDDSLAQLDPATLLWEEIAARARAVLEDVHQLAAAYGWPEHDILALSRSRRSAYLALVRGEAI